MNAEVTLYTKAPRVPVDVVATEHEGIDLELETWGRWNRERLKRIRCGSMERNHRRTRAGDQTREYPRLPISLPENARNRMIDRAVLRIAVQHRDVLVMHYVEQRQAFVICRQLIIRFEDFKKWMHDARCMVLNQLRFLGS